LKIEAWEAWEDKRDPVWSKLYLGTVSGSGCASQYAWVRFLAIMHGLVPCEKRPKDKSDSNTITLQRDISHCTIAPDHKRKEAKYQYLKKIAVFQK
jgi:hypothetical protein